MNFRIQRLIFGAQASVCAIALTWCIAAAAQSIPAVLDGGRTLVAVEPLLRTLEIGYVIEGDTLTVDGRRFPASLIERSGNELVEAKAIASFLHMTLSNRNGVVVFSGPQQAPDASQSAAPAPSELEALRARLLDALNEHRAANGEGPLRFDGIAQEAAQYQAGDMAREGKMRHQDASGRTPMQRYADFGGHTEAYGENVGWYGLAVASEAALWTAVAKLDSEMMAEQPPDDGHREAILNQRYKSVGIGVSVGPHGLYLAEDFVGR